MGLKMYNVCPFLHASCGCYVNICVTDEHHCWESEPFVLQLCWLSNKITGSGFTRPQRSANIPQKWITARRLPLWHTESKTDVQVIDFFCHSNAAYVACLIC